MKRERNEEFPEGRDSQSENQSLHSNSPEKKRNWQFASKEVKVRSGPLYGSEKSNNSDSTFLENNPDKLDQSQTEVVDGEDSSGCECGHQGPELVHWCDVKHWDRRWESESVRTPVKKMVRAKYPGHTFVTPPKKNAEGMRQLHKGGARSSIFFSPQKGSPQSPFVRSQAPEREFQSPPRQKQLEQYQSAFINTQIKLPISDGADKEILAEAIDMFECAIQREMNVIKKVVEECQLNEIVGIMRWDDNSKVSEMLERFSLGVLKNLSQSANRTITELKEISSSVSMLVFDDQESHKLYTCFQQKVCEDLERAQTFVKKVYAVGGQYVNDLNLFSAFFELDKCLEENKVLTTLWKFLGVDHDAKATKDLVASKRLLRSGSEYLQSKTNATSIVEWFQVAEGLKKNLSAALTQYQDVRSDNVTCQRVGNGM